jgi:hypothetical protein
MHYGEPHHQSIMFDIIQFYVVCKYLKAHNASHDLKLFHTFAANPLKLSVLNKPVLFPLFRNLYERVILQNIIWNKMHLQKRRYVYEENDSILGWIALSPVSEETACSGVAEVSVYIERRAKHGGIAALLLTQTIASSEKEGLWTLQATIMQNKYSCILLFQKCVSGRLASAIKSRGTVSAHGERLYLWKEEVNVMTLTTAVIPPVFARKCLPVSLQTGKA